ncbi:MAG: GspH/FimT family pseudopilin [Pseudomonas gingeri]
MYRQAGVTLLETMVAIAIMGIVMAWGLPSLSDVISNNTIKSTTDVIFSALQEARSEALKRNTSVSATLTATAVTLAGSNYAKTISLAGAGTGTTISQNPAGAITFTSTGQIAASASYVISITNASCPASNACLKVEAYGGGFIKVCNPSQGDRNASNFCS